MTALPHHDSAVAPSAAITAANAAPDQPAPRTAGGAHASPLPTWAWLTGSAMLAAIVGLTTALVHHAEEEAHAQQEAAMQPDLLAGLPPTAAGSRNGSLDGSLTDVPAHRSRPQADDAPLAPAAAQALAPARSAAPQTAPPPPADRAPAGRTAPVAAATAGADPAVAAVRCSTCGTVESVRAVQVAGQGTGLGAIAGGVVGGAVGNQFGKGSGNTAMTVLGAVGGGYAGHEIEKRARSQTVYQVRVRMQDGSLRTLQSGRAWSVGEPVRVQGGTLRAGTGSA